MLRRELQSQFALMTFLFLCSWWTVHFLRCMVIEKTECTYVRMNRDLLEMAGPDGELFMILASLRCKRLHIHTLQFYQSTVFSPPFSVPTKRWEWNYIHYFRYLKTALWENKSPSTYPNYVLPTYFFWHFSFLTFYSPFLSSQRGQNGITLPLTSHSCH